MPIRQPCVYLSHDELVEAFHNLHRGQIGQVCILLQGVRWLREANMLVMGVLLAGAPLGQRRFSVQVPRLGGGQAGRLGLLLLSR